MPVTMKTYQVTFTVKGKQECMPFIARSSHSAVAALRRIYAGIAIQVLYVVCDEPEPEPQNTEAV